jgi:hypothetical protein
MISTIAELNAHHKHWQEKKALRQRCVAAPSVVEFAFENWKSETATGRHVGAVLAAKSFGRRPPTKTV